MFIELPPLRHSLTHLYLRNYLRLGTLWSHLASKMFFYKKVFIMSIGYQSICDKHGKAPFMTAWLMSSFSILLSVPLFLCSMAGVCLSSNVESLLKYSKILNGYGITRGSKIIQAAQITCVAGGFIAGSALTFIMKDAPTIFSLFSCHSQTKAVEQKLSSAPSPRPVRADGKPLRYEVSAP